MSTRNYTNTATEATLTGAVGSSDTSFTLTSFAGFPPVPFTAAIERGTANEEIVLVTAVSVSTVTATRGYDSTTPKSHAAGAAFLHVTIAKDYIEANQHINTASGVHGLGLGSAVVGTTDTQTLTNKTLTTPTVSSPTVTGTSSFASGTFSGGVTVAGATTLAALTATGATSLAALTAASAAISGTLAVTGATTLGALTATTSTATGLVKGAGVESTAELTLAQIGAPAGVTGKGKVWTQSDGGLYTRAGTGTVARAPMHWGSGTTYPTTALNGDLFFHTGLGCTMRWNGTAFRQAETPIVADAAGRNAITTSALYAGFLARQTDTGNTLEWDGSRWVKVDGPPQMLYGGGVSVTTTAPNGANTRIINISVSSADVAANAVVTLVPNVQCFSNAAFFADLKVNGATVNQLNRYHSQSTAGPPLPFPVSASARLIPGANTFELWLNVDPGGGGFQCQSGNASIWI